MRYISGTFLLGGFLLLAGCGGGRSGSSAGSGGGGVITTAPLDNVLPVTVDSGPAAINAAGNASVNTLFASVTLCTPGSTSACETIDHMQVDTGSTGVRFLAPALSGTAVPTALNDAASGNPLRECVQFADGYAWGSLVIADVKLGSRTISSLPVHIIGDQASGTPPASCVSGPQEDTVAAFGSNGVIGIGNYLQDCGQACANSAIAANYYICPNGSCTPVSVPLQSQAGNPIAAMGSDNNGVLVDLPVASSPGTATLQGNLHCSRWMTRVR
jgi:hypothetical protein